MDLFDSAAEKDLATVAPLADRVRPRSLGDFVGQEHLTGANHFLRRSIELDQLPSLILCGPPGTGKTTLARVIAESTQSTFVSISAVLAGVKDIREIVAKAQTAWSTNRRRTILFIDEIHRFNKAQQDALLPHVEKGTLTLIGATTENPSFEVNSALLSRCRVIVLKPLEEEEIIEILKRALRSPRGLNDKFVADEDALLVLAQAAGGDARKALNALELAVQIRPRVDRAAVEEALQKKTLLYDKAGDEHYNVISAFIKSMRGSDPDAALYWMSRMLEAGEDPLFILRRMVILASEDIGNADPQALVVAVSALQAFEFVGLPEGTLPMTQAVTYLALAPKSNTVLTSFAAARGAVEEHGTLPVPLHLRNAPTPLMKSLGYGGGYQYPHNFEGNYVPERYLPEELVAKEFVKFSESGAEKELGQRLKLLRTPSRNESRSKPEDQ